MSKKTVILTQEQLDEINGGAGFFEYLDGMSSNPDMGSVFTKEVSADGGNEVNSNYPETPLSTDEFSSTLTRDSWPRDSRSYGKNGNLHNVTEMTKKDWEKAHLLSEKKSQNGWKSFNTLQLGDSNHQVSPEAEKQREYRERVAADKAINGATPEEKQNGMKSLATMQQNTPRNNSYAKAKHQLRNLKNTNKLKKPDIGSTNNTQIGTIPTTTKKGGPEKVEGGYII